MLDLVNQTVLSMVKPGDTIEIEPIDKFPNAERKFKVDGITEEGFLYGLSEYCDGYAIPFYWIKNIKIVKGE